MLITPDFYKLISDKKYNRSQFYIRKMFPNWHEKYYYRLDLIITPILGTLLAIITINPIDLSSAFFSGLIWHYTFMSSIREKKK